MRRKRLSRKTSRKMFKKSAVRTHKRNLGHVPMRGGIKL